uniref:Uncharacterized protein n=1 Tax=Arundo donax TaxID=35708 RepID=A0A0A9H6D7_ARUDO
MISLKKGFPEIALFSVDPCLDSLYLCQIDYNLPVSSIFSFSK